MGFNCYQIIFSTIIFYYNQCVSCDNLNCGRKLLTTKRGSIMTPNFPSSFPLPIHCQWILTSTPSPSSSSSSSSSSVILLHMNELYLQEGLTIDEYLFYVDDDLNGGQKRLNLTPSSTVLISRKSTVVLSLNVVNDENAHLRSYQYFMNTFGFNITYEILPLTADTELHLSDHFCSAYTCSLTGKCVVSGDYRHNFCSCFDDFFGNNCEYGPLCDPVKSVNPCMNGGKCR